MNTKTQSSTSSSQPDEETAIENVSPQRLHDWLEDDDVLLVDVREAMEHARESIPGSRRIDVEDLANHQLVRSNDKKLVVHCNSGNRSSEACKVLAGQYPETIYNLADGIQAWKKAGYETDFNEDAPIGIQRQVQITAGSLVLAGTVAGLTLSPWFYAIPLFVGTGLLYAGVSGTCGMALLLSRMPWNPSDNE